MIRHNAGLLLFAQRDWKGALKQFQAASNADPTDPAAANNAAVARIYDGQVCTRQHSWGCKLLKVSMEEVCRLRDIQVRIHGF